MQKQELISALEKEHRQFTGYIASLSDSDFMCHKEGKWTPGQQLDHIVRAVSPLILAFTLPRFVPRLMFGKANRPSKTNDELVAKYLSKIEEGGKASGKFIPPAVSLRQKDKLIRGLHALVDKLCKQIGSWKEKDLDTVILPHPLLGKITAREMLYFTIYHVTHHEKITKRDLAKTID